MSFKDMFKNSFYEQIKNLGLDIDTIIVMLLFSTILALYIYFIYRIITKKTFYSKTFNLSLTVLTIIITAIILTIQSNLVISLGMVGALSIVRFRTAIKDPMDLMFLFWSISIGIICGAGLPSIAFLESLIITVLIFTLNLIPIAKTPMLLVINSTKIDKEEEILKIVNKHTKYYKIKSRNIFKDGEDIIIELRLNNNSNIIQDIAKLKYIINVSLLDHDGESTF